MHRRETNPFRGSAVLADGERTRVVAHLLEYFGFDLTDALARDAKFLANFLERVADAVPESKRISIILRSRGVRNSSIACTFSLRSWRFVASNGFTASSSSMKSPSFESSSDPTGDSSEMMSWLIFWICATFLISISISTASSSSVGSRPSSCTKRRWVCVNLLMVSTMCTGMRMVRAWSAMARVMA